MGVPAGLQGMVVSVSNVMVMYYINGFGSAAVAGFSSANKFDNFLGLPVNSFMLAITTFVSQNLGAKKYDRVKQGIRAALIMSLATVIVLGVIVMTLRILVLESLIVIEMLLRLVLLLLELCVLSILPYVSIKYILVL